jgi:hypothetical protein
MARALRFAQYGGTEVLQLLDTRYPKQGRDRSAFVYTSLGLTRPIGDDARPEPCG